MKGKTFFFQARPGSWRLRSWLTSVPPHGWDEHGGDLNQTRPSHHCQHHVRGRENRRRRKWVLRCPIYKEPGFLIRESALVLITGKVPAEKWTVGEKREWEKTLSKSGSGGGFKLSDIFMYRILASLKTLVKFQTFYEDLLNVTYN